MNLLRLHELIASTGDGLHPDLVRLFEERAAIETNPRIVDLGERRAAPVQAGPSPTAARPGLFVQGNVLRLVPQAAEATNPLKTSKKA